MNTDELKAFRTEYNQKLKESDSFFKKFGMLDDEVYAEGAIDAKHKQLMGLAISVLSRCNECICYHIEECIHAGASKQEMIEAIKIGVIGGGSITYPNARFAIKTIEDFLK